MIKRLVVWLVETSFEVLVLGLALIVLFGHDQHAFFRSLVAYATGIILFSFTTGYLLTTAVARGAWRGQQWWSYSTIAVGLFLVHSEIFFVISGGSKRPEQFSIQVAGAFVVFACTFCGTVVLRRWTAIISESARSQS